VECEGGDIITEASASLKMTVFWDVVPRSLVKIDRHFKGAKVLTASIMRAISTSEMSVNFYQTARRNIPEDSHLHTHRRENLKSSWKLINIISKATK
jgi:hypothetical protein